jgi:hypothetical protein
MYTECNIEATTVAVEKQLYISVFVVLGKQYAMHMHHTVIYGLPGSIVFPHYLISGTTFGKKLLDINCVF